jgi:opacity protein-like surface antigen
MKRIYGMAMLAALFALAASAQDAVMQKKMQEELNTALTRMKVIGMEGGVMSDVKGAPYRADQITESTQTLGDGTRIHNEHQVTIYRDSQGRVRRETPEQVSIWDPNTGVGYTLNTKNMTASKMSIQVSVNSGDSGTGLSTFRIETVTGGSGIAVGGGENVRILTKSLKDAADDLDVPKLDTVIAGQMKAQLKAPKESLGAQILEGVSAQGDRQTTTIDAGAIGNDRPIQIVSERWYSPDLQMEVMTRHSDPRTGEQMTRLININRAEPDPSLFQVPAGYSIVEGKQMPALFKQKQ